MISPRLSVILFASIVIISKLDLSEESKSVLGNAGIFPGTFWCGAGNVAESRTSLGIFSGSDRCCRDHDMCPYKIHKLSSKYGLYNARLHTLLHCNCDEVFRTCLKMEGSQKSQMIGRFFFDQLRPPCFVIQQGSVCMERTWWGHCLQYNQTGLIGSWRDPLSFDITA